MALVLPSMNNYAEVFSLAITEAWVGRKFAITVGETPL